MSLDILNGWTFQDKATIGVTTIAGIFLQSQFSNGCSRYYVLWRNNWWRFPNQSICIWGSFLYQSKVLKRPWFVLKLDHMKTIGDPYLRRVPILEPRWSTLTLAYRQTQTVLTRGFHTHCTAFPRNLLVFFKFQEGLGFLSHFRLDYRRQWSLVDNDTLRYKHLNQWEGDCLALDRQYGFMSSPHQMVTFSDEEAKVKDYNRSPAICIVAWQSLWLPNRPWQISMPSERAFDTSWI